MIPMDYGQYDAWSENARLARMEYLKGKLTAEELESYETDKAEVVEETAWQRLVAGDVSFDPETHYPEAIQELDFRAEHPK